jgi:hypothetical protein
VDAADIFGFTFVDLVGLDVVAQIQTCDQVSSGSRDPSDPHTDQATSAYTPSSSDRASNFTKTAAYKSTAPQTKATTALIEQYKPICQAQA